jgi:glycosyltransferase involved in cell wall biosynthesis
MLDAPPVKILHISESDGGGGAGVAAFRMHSGLRALGHESRMLVGRRLTGSPEVRSIKRGVGWRAADRAFGEVFDRFSLQYVFYPSSFGVARDPWFTPADIVQLHNTHGSYFSHSALPSLSRRKPVVWFLHDQWAFTGHVAYSYDCDRWRHGCGSCPYLSEYPALARDRTAALWRWKRRVYARSRLTLVTPSRWLAGLVRKSPLLARFPVHVVPNGVDLEVFRPGAREALKSGLGLDPARPVLLWVSADPNDRRKGADLVSRLVGDAQLLTMGGDVQGEAEAARRYAAADALLLPSRLDNLPNTAVESIACGTPVAAFDVGGVPEVVRPGETGVLAPLGDVAGLADAVRRLIGDEELRGKARAVAEAEYSLELQARRLAELYEGAVRVGA